MDSENTPKCYTMRIKVQDSVPLTSDILKQWLNAYGALKWVFSFENGTNKSNAHYHIVYLTSLKDTLVDYVKTIYPHFKGNAFFSHTPAKDIDLAIRYTLKDGEYEFQGFAQNYIEEQYKLSYRKSGDGNLSREIDKIRELFLSGKVELYKCVDMYVDLLVVKYNKTVNRNHMKSLILSWELQRSTESRRQFCKELVSEIRRDISPYEDETDNYISNNRSNFFQN